MVVGLQRDAIGADTELLCGELPKRPLARRSRRSNISGPRAPATADTRHRRRPSRSGRRNAYMSTWLPVCPAEAARTTSTGRSARARTARDVLPMTTLLTRPRPRDPTIRSAKMSGQADGWFGRVTDEKLRTGGDAAASRDLKRFAQNRIVLGRGTRPGGTDFGSFARPRLFHSAAVSVVVCTRRRRPMRSGKTREILSRTDVICCQELNRR